MRCLLIAMLVLCIAPASPAQDEVPIAAEEEEVNFDEEEEVGTPDRPEVDFEQETSAWLLVFPLLFVGLLARNVQWRKPK